MQDTKKEYESLTITSALAQVLTFAFYTFGLEVEAQTSYAFAFLVIQVLFFFTTRYGRIRATKNVDPLI